jgi:hypothetical protein
MEKTKCKSCRCWRTPEEYCVGNRTYKTCDKCRANTRRNYHKRQEYFKSYYSKVKLEQMSERAIYKEVCDTLQANMLNDNFVAEEFIIEFESFKEKYYFY